MSKSIRKAVIVDQVTDFRKPPYISNGEFVSRYNDFGIYGVDGSEYLISLDDLPPDYQLPEPTALVVLESTARELSDSVGVKYWKIVENNE